MKNYFKRLINASNAVSLWIILLWNSSSKSDYSFSNFSLSSGVILPE